MKKDHLKDRPCCREKEINTIETLRAEEIQNYRVQSVNATFSKN